ncbi:MAG: hypothetical protein NC177_10080 [Ruminococcus flavefaciens]|nr:hypothetical protein [Ruminococcus flavefaciens]
MWGIYLDISLPELFQHEVEFKKDSENAIILNPVHYIKVPMNKIKLTENAPDFVYGETVSPVSRADITGKINTIIWHFKRNEFYYYIEVNGKKKSVRYFSSDLKRV